MGSKRPNAITPDKIGKSPDSFSIEVPAPPKAIVLTGYMAYKAVEDLRYASVDRCSINATVTFVELGPVPYTLCDTDSAPHGIEILEKVRAGEYGPVAECLPPSRTEQEAAGRAWRDDQLQASQWPVERHRDQVAAGVDATLTSDQYFELLSYRQSLRDWPDSEHFPSELHRPEAPEWLKALEERADSSNRHS